MWATLPMSLRIAYYMYRKKVFHPALEWFMISLIFVPVANITQSIYVWTGLLAFTVLMVLRVAYLDFKANGFIVLQPFRQEFEYVNPVFFEFINHQ